MIRDIITTADPLHAAFLQMKCAEVPREEAVYKVLAADLIDTANAHWERCAGLAANQIHIGYTAFAIKFGRQYLCIINPLILAASAKKVWSSEGCLSVIGKTSKVRRYKWVKVRYLDPSTGEYTVRRFIGFESFVCQHEMDHGNGILI